VSAIAVELRESKSDGSFYVQVYLKNNTANESIQMNPMTIFGCDRLCPLHEFMEIVSDKVVSDFDAVCQPRSSKRSFLMNLKRMASPAFLVV
jgi:hypothetical protein